MSGLYADFDDLYVAIIMALSDEEVRSLPANISVEELAQRYPEVFAECEEKLKAHLSAQNSAKFGV